MPSAHAILWFLGMFLVLWALSLLLRGLYGDRSRGRRRCPACAAAITDTASLTCTACGYEARAERALLAPRRNWNMIVAGGVLVLVGGGVCYLGAVVWAWTHMTHDVGFALTAWSSAALALASFAIVLIAWAIRGERSRGRRRCPRCWYDMSGSGLRCPECGFEARHSSALYRPRRRWKAAALASLLLLGAAILHGVPRVQRGGWRAAFPTTVLIATLPWLPDSLSIDPDPGLAENWTLDGRFQSDYPWEWQTRWLRTRARRMLADAASTRDVRVALNFSATDIRAPATRRALLLCVQGLSSASKPERRAAVECIDEFRALYDRPSPRLQEAVAPLLPDLLRLLRDPNQPADIVVAAAWAASLSGPGSAPAVPDVLRVVSRMGRVAIYTGTGLGTLRALALASPDAHDAVIRAIDDPDPAIAQLAVMVLSASSLCNAAAAQRLLQILREGDDAHAAMAAKGLCRALWDPGVVIPAVLDQMESTRAERAALADALWNYEDELAVYVPRLADLLADPDPAVRCAVVNTINAISGRGRFEFSRSAAYPIIAAMRNDPDAKVREAASTLILEDPSPKR